MLRVVLLLQLPKQAQFMQTVACSVGLSEHVGNRRFMFICLPTMFYVDLSNAFVARCCQPYIPHFTGKERHLWTLIPSISSKQTRMNSPNGGSILMLSQTVFHGVCALQSLTGCNHSLTTLISRCCACVKRNFLAECIVVPGSRFLDKAVLPQEGRGVQEGSGCNALATTRLCQVTHRTGESSKRC